MTLVNVVVLDDEPETILAPILLPLTPPQSSVAGYKGYVDALAVPLYCRSWADFKALMNSGARRFKEIDVLVVDLKLGGHEVARWAEVEGYVQALESRDALVVFKTDHPPGDAPTDRVTSGGAVLRRATNGTLGKVITDWIHGGHLARRVQRRVEESVVQLSDLRSIDARALAAWEAALAADNPRVLGPDLRNELRAELNELRRKRSSVGKFVVWRCDGVPSDLLNYAIRDTADSVAVEQVAASGRHVGLEGEAPGSLMLRQGPAVELNARKLIMAHASYQTSRLGLAQGQLDRLVPRDGDIGSIRGGLEVGSSGLLVAVLDSEAVRSGVSSEIERALVNSVSAREDSVLLVVSCLARVLGARLASSMGGSHVVSSAIVPRGAVEEWLARFIWALGVLRSPELALSRAIHGAGGEAEEALWPSSWRAWAPSLSR